MRQAHTRSGGPAEARVISAAADTGRELAPTSLLPWDLGFLPGTLLDGRYEVVELLGQGRTGVTYRCRDTVEERDVAVKCLSLRSLVGGWKQLELFEREAEVLASLEHPGIPRYLASFEQDTERDRAFFLVQEAVQGASLAAMLASGWRPDEAEVARIASELLGTLRYLGGRQPPVVHRDVKPENIVVEGGQSGGKAYLVDFGSVQAAAAAADDPTSGATVVGTFGFMAPEQLRGPATPASDLYGLGATLLLLLSGCPPSALADDRLRLDLRSVKMGPPLRAVLEGLLEPAPEERMSAEEALEVLAGKKPVPARRARGGHLDPSAVIEKRPPYASKLKAIKRGSRLEIAIPPQRWKNFNGECIWLLVMGMASGIGWIVLWLLGTQLAQPSLLTMWTVWLWLVFRRHLVRERITIDNNSWKVERQLGLPSNAAKWRDDGILAALTTRRKSGPTADLQFAYLEPRQNTEIGPDLGLRDQNEIDARFGEALADHEFEWVLEVINEHLGEIQK